MPPKMRTAKSGISKVNVEVRKTKRRIRCSPIPERVMNTMRSSLENVDLFLRGDFLVFALPEVEGRGSVGREPSNFPGARIDSGTSDVGPLWSSLIFGVSATCFLQC